MHTVALNRRPHIIITTSVQGQLVNRVLALEQALQRATRRGDRLDARVAAVTQVADAAEHHARVATHKVEVLQQVVSKAVHAMTRFKLEGMR